jgi:CO/xanthine dehydrogenase FAD-binding subunit
MLAFAYEEPVTLPEAVEAVSREGAVPIAGGTDLVLFMKRGRVSPRTVVSLRRVPDLKGIEVRPQGDLFIGAGVTWTEILAHAQVAERAGVLAQAARVLGSPQIRNVATVGGNLCTAAPSADGAPPLLALDAVVHLAGSSGRRQVPLTEFFLGPFRTVCADTREILLGFTIPGRSLDMRGCYLKHSIRNSMDLSMLGVAAVVQVGEEGVIQECRVALGTAGPTPRRAFEAERVLRGERVEDRLLEAAAEAAAAEASPRSSWRASAEYRRALVKVLVKRALRTCLGMES